MRKIGRIALGVFLVIIGLIGWILPIVPGWPALIPGLVILSDYIPPLKRVVDKIKKRMEEGKQGKGYFRW